MKCLILGETLLKWRIYQVQVTGKERTPNLLVTETLQVIIMENRKQGVQGAELKAHLTVLYIYHKNTV